MFPDLEVNAAGAVGGVKPADAGNTQQTEEEIAVFDAQPEEASTDKIKLRTLMGTEIEIGFGASTPISVVANTGFFDKIGAGIQTWWNNLTEDPISTLTTLNKGLLPTIIREFTGNEESQNAE